jgi:hypothetical protein
VSGTEGKNRRVVGNFGATDIPLRVICNPFQNKFLVCYHAGGYSLTMKHLDFRHALASLPSRKACPGDCGERATGMSRPFATPLV